MSDAFDLVDTKGLIHCERYRAKIAFVSPSTRRDTFEREAQCFLGISLENRNFLPNRFHSIVEWASRRFDKCTLLIGDSIHRITLETTEGMEQDAALSRALQLGQYFLDDNEHILAAYGDTTEFESITCSSLQKTNAYQTYYAGMTDYFERSPSFRESVESFGRNYHRHEWERLSVSERVHRLKRSSEYFLEEFAIFACLVEQGNTVMIYPGSFSTLAEIADGRFPGILPPLEALTVVSLMLKRR